MPKVGDKYIIEIAEEYKLRLNDGTVKVEDLPCAKLYRVRGVKDTFFEEDFFDNTPRYNFDEAYNRGLNEAWETAAKILVMNNIGREKTFGKSSYNAIIYDLTAAEAIAKIKEYEDKKAADEIKVGDELQNSKTKEKGIVVFLKDLRSYPTYCLFGNSGIFSIEGEMLKHWQKTGRHFPQVAEILKELGDKNA